MTGATQKSQSCAKAQSPTKMATPVLLAGLTEVLVTGMLIKWFLGKYDCRDCWEFIKQDNKDRRGVVNESK